MHSEAAALTPPLPASRTLAEVVADLARLKAHIERTDQDLADYWHHYLTLCAFTAQLEADHQHFHSDIDSLRPQIVRMWEQARWVVERQESAPQKSPATGGTNGEEVGLAVGPPGGSAGLLTQDRQDHGTSRQP